MSFKEWFRRWIRSFYLLLSACLPHRKSEKQRKKERKRRMKAKLDPYRPFKKKRKYKRRHPRYYKVLKALCDFGATTLGILLLPFGLFHWGYKSVRVRSNNSKAGRKSVNRATVTRTARNTAKNVTQKKTEKSSTPTVTSHRAEEKKQTNTTYTPHIPILEREIVVTAPPPAEFKELDEDTPKSTPKNGNDRYIRKRLIIAGSSYCDTAVLSRLQIGTCIELEAEPDNPYDKDAIKLLFEGDKIGYIAKADRPVFATCLKLGRKIYGVITNIIRENDITEYEYETWFESSDNR